MRKGYNRMKKGIYYTPDMSIFMINEEDVICASGDADTDVPFQINTMSVDTFS